MWLVFSPFCYWISLHPLGPLLTSFWNTLTYVSISPLILAYLFCLSSFFFALLNIGFYFFLVILLLFKYSCLHLPPTTPPHPSHPHFPPLLPPPLGFVHVSFIVVSENPPCFAPLSPPTSSLVAFRWFLISVSLVMFCLLVCFVD